jgi:Tfp pilus assembly protein PilN
MKPLVNLASEPFRNRRLFWLIIITIFAVSSAVGFRTIQAITDLDRRIEALEPLVKQDEKKAAEMKKAAASISSSLTPEQNHALQAANTLIARKAFSWTQLLNDLERHVPNTVRVVKISVDKIGQRAQGAAQDQAGKTVSLTFSAVGKNVMAVTEMIESLSKSGFFIAEPRSITPLDGVEDVEFVIAVEYQPAASQRPSRAGLANQVAEGGR